MKKKVFLGLGSNLGDKQANILSACALIAELDCIILKKSSFYVTPPWGFEANDTFLNIVIKVSTNIAPLELLSKVKDIEMTLGRKKKTTGVYTSRKIDIDILDYNGEVYDFKELVIPHTHLVNRNFVIIPLYEIEPTWEHPITNESILFLKSQVNREDIYRF